MLGGDTKKPGFPCKPDTVYEFKFELKGTAELAMVNFYQWDDKATRDAPVKENDHAMDDIRYFVTTFIDAPRESGFALSVRR